MIPGASLCTRSSSYSLLLRKARGPVGGRVSLATRCTAMAAAPTVSKGGLEDVLANNRNWAKGKTEKDPDFFHRLRNQQAPDYFWIGCSDSRVPANEILGLDPGEVFVQRNVGNLCTHKDMNCMASLEFAVTALKVKHVILCGHYNCGAVKGSITFPAKTAGLVNLWISDIRDTRNKFADLLKGLTPEQQNDRLCELNVQRQVFNICTSPVVQATWESGQELAIHGVIYSVGDGILKELTTPILSNADLEKAVASQGSAKLDGQSTPPKEAFTGQLAGSVRDHLSWSEAH